MKSPSRQVIYEMPHIQADPIPEMPTIDKGNDVSTYRQSNTNICNVEQTILSAIYEGHIEQLKTLKIYLRDLNYLEEFNDNFIDKQISPLTLAVATGQLEVVKLLLQNEGIDINLATKSQELSPLKLACNNGYYEIAELLVQQGADVNQASHTGSVPLFYCFNRLEEESNYFENKQLCFKLGELLIDHGANIDAIVNQEKGYTLLMLFCSVKEKLNNRDLKVNLDVIKFLVSHGAQKDLQSKKGKTVFELSKQHAAKEIVQKILQETKQSTSKAFSHRPPLIQQHVVKVEGQQKQSSVSCCGLLSSSRQRPQQTEQPRPWWQFF
ncbi:hypothetical protein pb186bvf_015351 [Paramecium bursaria]